MTQRNRYIALAVLAVGLLITLPMTWWTARSGAATNVISASGWHALEFIRLLLLVVIVNAGLLAVAGLTGGAVKGQSVRDIAHVVVALAALALLALLFRLVAAPHFAYIGQTLDGLPDGNNNAATAAIQYSRSAAVFFATIICAGIVGLAFAVARAEEGGFDPRHLIALAASARSRIDRRSAPQPQLLSGDTSKSTIDQ